MKCLGRVLPKSRASGQSGLSALTWLLFLILGQAQLVSAGSATTAFLEIGTQRQLFVDSYIIQSLTDARQVLNQAVKHPASPVVKQDRPWEGNLIQTGSVVYDGDAKLFKMWYYTGQFVLGTNKEGRPADVAEGSTHTAYAFSRDGIHWEKPNLGLVEFEGSRDNNLLAERNLPPAFWDSHETNPAKRFKAFSHTDDTTAPMQMDFYYSADGFNWTPYEGNPVIDTSPRTGRWGPTVFMGWDPIRKVYAVHMESCLHRRCPMRKRVIGRAESPDGIHWSETQTIIVPDEEDYPDTEFYAMAAFTHADLYLGLISIFRTTNTRHYPELISSRDGIRYRREYREPFFPNGDFFGDFDDTSIYVFAAPIIHDGKVWIYYIGANWRGPDTLREKGERARRAIGLATLPVDNFVSIDGGKLRPGVLVTRLFSFEGDELYLNMEAAKRNAGAGAPEVKVEVVGPDQLLEGLKMEDADTLAETGRHRVSWGGKSDLSSLAGTPIQLRISVQNAKPYSFQFN